MGQSYKLIGAPCAHRGPYTFYKAFKYTKNNVTNILTINEFFFVKLWNDSDLISIGELRLLWEDKNCDRALASLRLYILPENTPDGRISDVHGEDEVLAITEKVVIKLEDLLTWITEATDWSWGLAAAWRHEYIAVNNDLTPSECNQKVNGESYGITQNEDHLFDNGRTSTLVDCSALDYSDVHREKRQLDIMNWEIRTGVVVLSYSRYCRYRGLLKRLEGVHNEWLRNKILAALGGFTTTCRTTKILFCKDTFDYPDLEGHELLCNHLAESFALLCDTSLSGAVIFLREEVGYITKLFMEPRFHVYFQPAPKLRSRIPKKKKQLYPTPDVSETDSSSNFGSDEDEHLSSTSSSVSTTSRNSYIASRSSSTTVVRNPHTQRRQPLDDSVQITAVDEQKKMKAFTQNLYAFMRARLTPIARLPCLNDKEINLFELYNKVKLLGGYAVVTSDKLWKYVYAAMAEENGNASTAAAIQYHYEKFLLPYEQHMAQQFKHVSDIQSSAKPQSSNNYKTNSSANEYAARLHAERKTQITNHARSLQSTANRLVVISKPGDKENIPLSEKRALARSTPEVIDLCEPDEENMPRVASGYRASSSSVPEVIDLCTESPIKRSVPSIAATLFPKKRKLDILRQGGLEVTPISSSAAGNAEPDVVTITKTVSGSNANYLADGEEKSVEILDPKKYSLAGRNCNDGNDHSARNSRPKSSQILDLRTIRNNGGTGDENLLKKISPSLGPNIEISLVPTEDANRDPKKRKSVQLPIPALRKISTGELSVKNLSLKTNFSNETNKYKPKVTIAAAVSRRKETNSSVVDVKPQVSITSSENAIEMSSSSSPPASDLASYVSNVNQSLYIAALYNSMFPSPATAGFIGIPTVDEDSSGAGSGAYQQQLSFLADSLLQQQQQQQQEEDEEINNVSLAQKFNSILKNNTVSIIEKYENILPD